MSDKDTLLRKIASLEGQPVPKWLAQACGDIAGYEEHPDSNLSELIKGQLMILMLKDIGGEKTFSVNDIDNGTREFLVAMKGDQVKREITLKLLKKPFAGGPTPEQEKEQNKRPSHGSQLPPHLRRQ